MALADSIEQFILDLLSHQDKEVDLQRNELAAYFKCAPSQINYVLSTRFSPDHGYLIESRRGGGGYVRIIRVTLPRSGKETLADSIAGIGDEITQRDTNQMLEKLMNAKVITPEQALLIHAATDARTLALPINLKDHLRANILRNMLLILYNRKEAV